MRIHSLWDAERRDGTCLSCPVNLPLLGRVVCLVDWGRVGVRGKV